MQDILEETALKQNEPEPQVEMPEPAATKEQEATQPEPMALAPAMIEPEVIEGVVLEIDQPEETADHPPPKQRPYWLCIPFTIMLCLSFLAVSLLLPLLTPSATITIIPTERSITITAPLQVPGRALLPLTIMQSTNALATGKRHQNATEAQGSITFFNGLLSAQNVPAGTILTGADGVQVVTDQMAIIPAGNPPSYGEASVSTHAVHTGSGGNIQAGDISVALHGTLLAKNLNDFTGGQNERDYTVVSKSDIDTAAGTLKTSLIKSEYAALAAQVQSGESLTPPLCSEKIEPDHQAGDEAAQVLVSVSETCSSVVYNAHDLYANATHLLSEREAQELGAGYSLISSPQVSTTHATIRDQARGIATLHLQVTGIYVYQITRDMTRGLVQHVAGKSKQQAMRLLSQFPGIQQVTIAFSGNNTLPADPGHIHIIILYQQ